MKEEICDLAPRRKWAGRITALAATASAVLLVTASAGFGSWYAWTQGTTHSVVLACLAVAMAVGLELAKPFALSAALDALKKLDIVSAVCMAVLASVAVAYSLTAELSLIATSRGDAVAIRATVARDGELLRREIDAIGVVRPSAAIKAEIDAALMARRDLQSCDGKQNMAVTAVREACAAVHELRAELATAIRRESLMQQAAPGNGGHTVLEPDPGAKALSTYLNALGVPLSKAVVSEWLVLVPVLALEIGSLLAVMLAKAGQPDERTGNSGGSGRVRPLSGQVSVAQPLDLSHFPTDAPIPLVPQLSAPDSGPKTKLLSALKDRGGVLLMSQRVLAETVGLSKSRTGEVLHALAADGMVKLTATPKGTLVQLSAASA